MTEMNSKTPTIKHRRADSRFTYTYIPSNNGSATKGARVPLNTAAANPALNAEPHSKRLGHVLSIELGVKSVSPDTRIAMVANAWTPEVHDWLPKIKYRNDPSKVASRNLTWKDAMTQLVSEATQHACHRYLGWKCDVAITTNSPAATKWRDGPSRTVILNSLPAWIISVSVTDKKNAVRAITGANRLLSCESLSAISGNPKRNANILRGCTPFLFKNIEATDATVVKTTNV